MKTRILSMLCCLLSVTLSANAKMVCSGEACTGGPDYGIAYHDGRITIFPSGMETVANLTSNAIDSGCVLNL